MSYGLVSDEVDTFGPTTQGMKALRDLVMQESTTGTQELSNFVTEGVSTKPNELAKECFRLSLRVGNENLKKTLANIGEAAAKSKKELRLC